MNDSNIFDRKKISLKPSLSWNDPVVVHATCVPRNKERCQFCLTAWPKQLIHIAHTNMFVYKAYLWDTTCRLSSKWFWTDRVNFNISPNGFLSTAITRRAAWPPKISQAQQWKLRAKLEGLHETKRRKTQSEIAKSKKRTNWVGTRDDTALVVSDVDGWCRSHLEKVIPFPFRADLEYKTTWRAHQPWSKDMWRSHRTTERLAAQEFCSDTLTPSSWDISTSTLGPLTWWSFFGKLFLAMPTRSIRVYPSMLGRPTSRHWPLDVMTSKNPGGLVPTETKKSH